MQLITIVYRYGEDCYLLAADGGLIVSYRDRAKAERTAAAIRALNLAGYRVDGENPQQRPGEPYGRVFIRTIIGPRVPNPYTLPRFYADQLAALVEMSPPRDVMGRSVADAIPPYAYALCAELRQLDPDDRGLLYSAERNDSAEAYRAVIKVAHGEDAARYVHPDNLASWIDSIAALCTDDGADRGFIPLIGGQHRAVWEALYAWLCARESREPLSAPLHRSIGGY